MSRAERSKNKYKSIWPGLMVSGWKFKRSKWLQSKENIIESNGNPWFVLVTPELRKGFQMINLSIHRYLPLALLGRLALPSIKNDMNQWHLLKWKNFACTFSNKNRQIDELIVRGIAILKIWGNSKRCTKILIEYFEWWTFHSYHRIWCPADMRTLQNLL